MSTVQEMAHAHLVTVQRTIQDLEKQKENIEAEIKKLASYLEEGITELNKESNTSIGEVVEKEDVSTN
jgi:hypothetical protein